MSPRRNHDQARQNNASNDHGDFASLEAELRAKQPQSPSTENRQERCATERTAARAEAEGFARVTGQHYQSRPTA